ncbi:hypothetical protein CEE45_04835 [Candidatus Heimdallarchaeota archaeon B3_Heim]|nr:MAG: hypothetical protein CEE45_04835 [Candidatus Heimdallarchaeota archaeon B3_Heim]
MIEAIFRSVKNKEDLFSKLEMVYTSDRRKLHLKTIFLDLTDDFIENKLFFLKNIDVEERGIKIRYDLLDEDLIRLRFYRARRYGKRIDASAILYLIDNKNGIIFLTNELTEGNFIQKSLLKLMHPLWRRIIFTESLLMKIEDVLNKEFDISHISHSYDGFDKKRNKWRYVSLEIPIGVPPLKLRIFQDGTIGIMTGSINDFLTIFSNAITAQRNENKSKYDIQPITFSVMGSPQGKVLELEFEAPLIKEEFNQIIDSLSKDLEERFLSTTIHSGNPFLHLNVFDPKTGSLFVLIAVRNIIRISADQNFDNTSLTALIESIHSCVGTPWHIKPLSVST